jgi:tRNA pseudouridine32 synthase/23S rRNA pseudouridine746 synthase
VRRKLLSPLPQRHGLDAARLRFPGDGPWRTVREHLVERLPMVEPARIDAMLAAGEIADEHGPITPDAPFVPHGVVWLHRDLPDEVPVPFELGVVHRDDELLVVDKPHFMATIPRGRHILQTALVKLRTQLDLPELSAAHRLDRVTAGLVMFVIDRERRGAYQTLFRDRKVHKEYLAVAPYKEDLPEIVRSRIMKDRGVITAYTVDGPPNAVTRVELLERRGDLALYRLLPATGRTHQLRLHLSELGIPILGDTFYPDLHDTPLDDFRRPLQLLASVLAFPDPLTGEQRRFTTRRTLRAWTSLEGWRDGALE